MSWSWSGAGSGSSGGGSAAARRPTDRSPGWGPRARGPVPSASGDDTMARRTAGRPPDAAVALLPRTVVTRPTPRNVLLTSLTFSSGVVDAIAFIAMGKVFTAFTTDGGYRRRPPRHLA